MLTYREAKKELTGKTVRAFGKYEGSVKKIVRVYYTKTDWVAVVKKTGIEGHPYETCICCPEDLEIVKKHVVGYRIASDVLLAAAK